MFEDTSTHDEISHLDDGHINLAPPSEYTGPVSHVLLTQLESGPVQITGKSLEGHQQVVELERHGKWVNCYRVVFGHRVGKAFGVAVETSYKPNNFAYTKEFKHFLDRAERMEDGHETILAKIHTYFK